MKKRSWVDIDHQNATHETRTEISDLRGFKRTTVTETKRTPKRVARTLWGAGDKVKAGLTVETETTVVKVTTTCEWDDGKPRRAKR